MPVRNPDFEFCYLNDFLKAVGEGKYVLGEKMLANIRLVQKGLAEGRFFFDKKKADRYIDFIERFIVYVKGEFKGHLKLECWQKYMTACIFGLVDEDGTRHFTEFPLIIARKQGKSAIAAAYEIAVGFNDKEAGMEIINVAPKLDQARIIFDQVCLLTSKNKALKKATHKGRDELKILKTNSIFKPLALNPEKSDGFNPQMVVYDEFAAWDANKGVKMYEVMKSGQTSRRQPINLLCSTANYVSEGLYDQIMERSDRALFENAMDDPDSKEARLLPFIFMVDDVDKWDDMNELRKAMPNLGVSVFERNIKDLIATAKNSLSAKAEFLTKYCNVKQNSSIAWLKEADVKATIGEALNIDTFNGCNCVAGADLSRTTDLTAAVLIIEKDGIQHLIAHFWLPEDHIGEAEERDKVPYRRFQELGYLTGCEGKVVDYHDVTEWFMKARDEHHINILMVGYDRYSASYWLNEMKSVGFRMDDVYQGTNLSPMIYEFEGMMVNHNVRTGTNGLLQLHLRNAAIKMATDEQAADNRVKLCKTNRIKRIDGVAAILDALAVRSKYQAEFGWMLHNTDWNDVSLDIDSFEYLPGSDDNIWGEEVNTNEFLL